MEFSRGKQLAARLRQLVPGGCHTYAKGDDQYPELAPSLIARGKGCHVWDVDGNQFIEYGMGLRAVTLGHAYPKVVNAVRASLELGTNFTRPGPEELVCAEAFLDLIRGADMVKFTKDGSKRDHSGAQAGPSCNRADVGRDLHRTPVLLLRRLVHRYDHVRRRDSATVCRADIAVPLQQSGLAARTVRRAPGQIAAVFLEPARTDEPAAGFLAELVALTHSEGRW